MKTKLFLLLAVASMSLAARAVESDVMTVHQTDGLLKTWALNDVQKITFLDENTMVVHTQIGMPQPIALDDVEKIDFVLSSSISTDVEKTIVPTDNGTRKVVENGQVVIIKDNVRYDLLGRKLK